MLLACISTGPAISEDHHHLAEYQGGIALDRYIWRFGWDGFVEYARQTDSGLVNQGWKDSYDSIFHADGTMASGPIALCEVQGYVFAAKTHAAKLAHRMARLIWRSSCAARRKSCGRILRRLFGVRISAPMLWRSTAARLRAGSGHQMRAMRSLPDSGHGRARVLPNIAWP